MIVCASLWFRRFLKAKRSIDFSSFTGIVRCHLWPDQDIYCTLLYSVNPWFILIHDDALKWHARWLFSIISTLAKGWWNIPKSQCTLKEGTSSLLRSKNIWHMGLKSFERVAKRELLESFVLNNFHIDTLFTFWWFETSYQCRVLLVSRNPNKLWISSLFITFAPLRWMKARTAREAGGCKIWSSWIRLGRLGKRFHISTLPEGAEGDPIKQQFRLVNHYTWPINVICERCTQPSSSNPKA